MSTPAAFSGAAYSRTAAVVSSANGSSPSISGTSRGHATGTTVDARVERVHERFVAAARDGRLRREQADPAVARRLHGRVRLGRDHADDGDAQLGLELRQGGRGRRVAGDDDELDALRLEVGADLAREAAHLVERTRPVGQPRAVAEVDEVLVRQRDEALVQHRQAADARVEHADRPLVHARDCREGGSR